MALHGPPGRTQTAKDVTQSLTLIAVESFKMLYVISYNWLIL